MTFDPDLDKLIRLDGKVALVKRDGTFFSPAFSGCRGKGRG